MPGVTLRDSATTIRVSSRALADGLVPLPDDVRGGIATSGEVMIEGTIGGFPFRSPAVTHEEGFCLALTPAQQKAGGVQSGHTVSLEITRIGDLPEVRVPADLLEALDASPEAAALWVVITPMARREWVRWIASAKQDETRARRIEVGIDKLTGGMRRPCCFPGLNWVTKDLVPPEETWAQLPGGKRAPA